MEEITEHIFVECENCIDKIKDQRMGGIYNCECTGKTHTVKKCTKCTQIKKNIYELENELDEIMYHLNYDIKHYDDCCDRIARIHIISNNLRHYNRLLLEKM